MKIKINPVILGFSLLCSLAVGLAGCGGGGGAAGPVAKVGVYVTDDLRTNTDAVWGTVYRVDLVASDSTVATVFDDSAGHDFNFRTLNDGTNSLYSFLSFKSVPADKTYNQVSITMGNTVKVLETGDSTSTTYNLVGAAAGAGKVKITYNLPSPRTFVDGDKIALDFDLANFVISGSDVTPTIKDSDRSGIEDDTRHESNEIKGTVAGLTGSNPDFQFTLTGEYGTVTVTTNVGTVFYNSDSSSNPTLANGKKVEVEGILDATTNTFTAYKVKIKVGNASEDPDQAKGQDSNRDATAGTFDLEATDTEGFVPTDRNIHVTTSDSTTYRGNNGALMTKADFFAALAAQAYLTVEAEGTYDSGSNTLAATRLKIEDEKDDHNDPHDGEVRGTGTNLNGDAGTLTITGAEAEGFVPGSTTVNVVTNGDTEFKDDSDQKVTKSQWFATIIANPTNQRKVKAEGTWDGTVFTASELKMNN